MRLKKKISSFNWIKNLKNLFFYWFVKLKRLNLKPINTLNKLLIFYIFTLFYWTLKFPQIKNTLEKLFFWRSFQLYHNKLIYLQYFWCFFFMLHFWYFPFFWWTKLVWSLLWLRNNGWMRWKISQLRFFYLKDIVAKKWFNFNKWIFYFLTKQSYSAKFNFKHLNILKYKWFIFFWVWKKYYLIKKHLSWLKLKITTKMFKNVKKKLINKSDFLLQSLLSKNISFWLKSLLLNLWVLKRVRKYNKFLFLKVIKKNSFWRLFWFENFYSLRNLFFWKGIINFSTSLFIYKDDKLLLFYTLNNLLEFIKLWVVVFKKINFQYKYNKINNYFCINWNFLGLGGLWLQSFESLLDNFKLFFKMNDKNFLFSFFLWYYDTFLQKKKYLPFNLVFKIQEIFKILYKNNNFTSSKPYMANALTLKIFDNLFFIFFNFSFDKLILLKNKNWNLLSHCYEKYPLYPNKNWNFLPFFSKKMVKKFKVKTIFTNLKKKTKLYYDNIFFFTKKLVKTREKWKIKIFSPRDYIHYHRLTTNIFFLKNMVLSKIFYMSNYIKLKWAKYLWYNADIKLSYDSILLIKSMFWDRFLFFSSTREKLINYAFNFWKGLRTFNFSWNFYTDFFGKLKFNLFWNKQFYLGKTKFEGWRKLSNSLSEYKKNDLFSTFFTFLTRTYLLTYMLQFGHTISTFNTSYWNYIIMIYNKWFILNILHIQLTLKWNLWLLMKMFYLGGSICLVSPFNILLEGLGSLYGAYTKQPYTWYIWVNGLISNFDFIYWSIKLKLIKAYSGKIFFSKQSIKKLLWLWFCSKGILSTLSIDITFFPSMRTSYWIFLESCAKFYPTITINNTTAFLTAELLDYYLISNDYSLLSLSFYINLLIISFKKSKFLRKIEFSVFPQKLIKESIWFKLLPLKLDIKFWEIKWQFKKIKTFFNKPKYLFLNFTSNKLAFFFKYLFFFWGKMLFYNTKCLYWRYIYLFLLTKKSSLLKKYP